MQRACDMQQSWQDVCSHLGYGIVTQAIGSSSISAPVLCHLAQVNHPPGEAILSRLSLRDASSPPTTHSHSIESIRQSQEHCDNHNHEQTKTIQLNNKFVSFTSMFLEKVINYNCLKATTKLNTVSHLWSAYPY